MEIKTHTIKKVKTEIAPYGEGFVNIYCSDFYDGEYSGCFDSYLNEFLPKSSCAAIVAFSNIVESLK